MRCSRGHRHAHYVTWVFARVKSQLAALSRADAMETADDMANVP